jgi:hypothetical protein
MRSAKKSLEGVWKAFDDATFGPRNTLNLRELLPTQAEARRRTEAWLRERQVSRAKQVLVITGRGNNSPAGISMVREGVMGLLAVLRRRGVVAEWAEHSPGSFVVKLAPISAMLEAPRRKRDRTVAPKASAPQSLDALEPATVELLRELAVRSLDSLGVKDPSSFLESEMLAKFNLLAASVTPGTESEERLRRAIASALDQLDD